MILINNNELSQIRNQFLHQTIVLAHGVFDIFHYGHFAYLKESKKLGGILVVTITADEFIDKGKGRPVFNTRQRMEIIDGLKFVDYSYVSNSPTPIDIIQTLKPNIYTKGQDVKGKELDKNENLFREHLELQSYGGGLVFINNTPMFHSTELIKHL